MSYLQRYVDGEHEAVWNELVELGEEVRAPTVLEEARSVAREAVVRIARNLEVLFDRWEAEGWEFGYPADLDERAFPRPQKWRRGDASREQRWLEAESRHGPLPIFLGAFISAIAEVNFVGRPRGAQRWNQWQVPPWPSSEEADPLQFEDKLEMIVDDREWMDFDADDGYPLCLPWIPDELLKYNCSGGPGFDLLVPDASFDPLLAVEGEPTEYRFGFYLRETLLKRGGFGICGAESLDAALVARLTKDLIPF